MSCAKREYKNEGGEEKDGEDRFREKGEEEEEEEEWGGRDLGGYIPEVQPAWCCSAAQCKHRAERWTDSLSQ